MKRIKLATIFALCLTPGTINTYAGVQPNATGQKSPRIATAGAVMKGYDRSFDGAEPTTWKQFFFMLLAMVNR